MDAIRAAREEDLFRLAEIFVFAKRVHYRPIIQDDALCFRDLQVRPAAEMLAGQLGSLWVYDRDFLWGFVGVEDEEIKQLFVDPLLEGRGVGGKLFAFAAEQRGGRMLWALEENQRALALYQRHGFVPTGGREPVEGTSVYAIQLALNIEGNEVGTT